MTEDLHVEVRGGATPDEIAAIVAVLNRRGDTAPIDATDPYERWRLRRLAALGVGRSNK